LTSKEENLSLDSNKKLIQAYMISINQIWSTNNMKFVILFTWLLGLGLPLLETYRRGLDHWLVHSMTMAGDYIMGAILICAGLALVTKKSYANLLSVIAWAYVLGVMNAAFWGHLEGSLRGVTLCDNNPTETNAIIVKGVIWLIALISVIISTRALLRKQAINA